MLLWSLSGRSCRAVSDCSLRPGRRAETRRLGLRGDEKRVLAHLKGLLCACSLGHPAVSPLGSKGVAGAIAQAVALLEVGQCLPWAECAQPGTSATRPFGEPLDGSGKALPGGKPGARIPQTGLEALQGTERAAERGGLAQTFFNPCRSCARVSLVSCIRISRLPWRLARCREPERCKLSAGKGRAFSLLNTALSIYASFAFTRQCFCCTRGQGTRVAPTLARRGMELQPDPLPARSHRPSAS